MPTQNLGNTPKRDGVLDIYKIKDKRRREKLEESAKLDRIHRIEKLRIERRRRENI